MRHACTLLAVAFLCACATGTPPPEPVTLSGTVEWVDTPMGKVARVGAGMTAPVVVKRVNPQMPDSERKDGTSGPVIMELIIDENGKVLQCNISSTPSPGLGFAAATAARQWVFRPGTIDGQPVPVLFPLTIAFQQ